MFAKLTETSRGVFGLPVVRTVSGLDGVVEITPNGKHKVSIGRLMPQTRALYGWYDFQEQKLPNHNLGAPTDTFSGDVVFRKYPDAVERLAPPPPPPSELEVLHGKVATLEDALLILNDRLLAVEAGTDITPV